MILVLIVLERIDWQHFKQELNSLLIFTTPHVYRQMPKKHCVLDLMDSILTINYLYY